MVFQFPPWAVLAALPDPMDTSLFTPLALDPAPKNSSGPCNRNQVCLFYLAGGWKVLHAGPGAESMWLSVTDVLLGQTWDRMRDACKGEFKAAISGVYPHKLF